MKEEIEQMDIDIVVKNIVAKIKRFTSNALRVDKNAARKKIALKLDNKTNDVEGLFLPDDIFKFIDEVNRLLDQYKKSLNLEKMSLPTEKDNSKGISFIARLTKPFDCSKTLETIEDIKNDNKRLSKLLTMHPLTDNQ